ncbi:hypothetical protein BDR04DRAFT_1027365, partial [Suillus decipiens]
THHSPLNQHLHHIGKSTSPCCPFCPEIMETIPHFLFDCHQYTRECHVLSNALCHKANFLTYLLMPEEAISPLMRYINSTGRFKTTFSEILD